MHMKSEKVKKKYLKFFKKKGHTVIASASLIPENDPTTLFTSSGMQPMIPYLLGETHPEGKRLTDSQRCFRTVDIDDVGDTRHTTYFRMLGNWSLGDYFKEDQIKWIFEFLTKELKLDPKRIYVSVFRGQDKFNIPKDEEAAEIWQQVFKDVGIEAKIADNSEINGMHPGERIFYFDENENWWSRAGVTENMPVGEPGGPDSEMFWDLDPENKHSIHKNSKYKDKPCHVACECGRFFEIGNSVFMAYRKTETGFEELKNKNIDFGGGLERMTMAVNDMQDIFLLDIFDDAKEGLEKLSGKSYTEDEKTTKAFRVILDHLRASVFLIEAGAVPSNKDQGYFTRRLIRRAIRFGRDLGINQNFCQQIAKNYIEDMEDNILSELDKEETKFRATLEKGLKEFEKGTDPFILFTTYGFPIEMTQELAKEQGRTVDLKAFEHKMKEHQEISKQGLDKKFKGGLADSSEKTIKLHTTAHLMLAALRQVLGDHVEQKGSNITEERLRFDFSHGEKMTDEQKQQVEDLVNKQIQEALPINCEEMTVEEAEEAGAVGVFKDRYGEKVKVYKAGEEDNMFSYEICGGPHVKNTSELGKFKIKKEQSSSAGVRRIKAILE